MPSEVLGRTNGGFDDEFFLRVSERASDAVAPVSLAALAVVGAVGGVAVVSRAIKSSPLSGAPSPVSPASAARFLTQASFGASDSSIAEVQSAGIAGWINNQLAMPVPPSHLSFVQQLLVQIVATRLNAGLRPPQFYQSFWQKVIAAPDQLRQRVKMALSEIFVISLLNREIAVEIAGAASYYDMLTQNAFGNFRTLLEQVTLHPMMGVYLTCLGNLPANPATGQHPDENFAREVMQLMTVGLYQLNPDGTTVTDGSGNPTPTYSHADIAGLAAVFTGFSWYSANPTTTGASPTFYPKSVVPSDPLAAITPMIPYPVYHQTTSKTFLGTTIPASTAPDPISDLKIALDTLFMHPNVGPFIGKQLIQRLVTSNPSPDYVSRVTAVFNDDGAGVRGNLAAVVTAILTDTEARDDTVFASPTFGKLREPLIRVANWARAFSANSTSGQWLVTTDTNPPIVIDQAPLTAPSVFNFWVPGYIPPQTRMGALSLMVPEFQAVDEVSVAGYLNTIMTIITSGLGAAPKGSIVPDVQPNYSTEIALAHNSANLVARINLLLTNGQMSSGLEAIIMDAVDAILLPKAGSPASQLNSALLRRVEMAIFLTFASSEYIVQR
jgi:uncharacterized protein (DUF1800 family)